MRKIASYFVTLIKWNSSVWIPMTETGEHSFRMVDSLEDPQPLLRPPEGKRLQLDLPNN